MTQFSAELYATRHTDDPGMNDIEKIVVGALIGFGAASVIFVIAGLVVAWAGGWA